MRYFTAVLPLLIGSAFAGGPGGPSNVKSAAEGPDKLAKCGCSAIFDKVVECQADVSKTGVSSETKDCVCVDNSQPDAWYSHIHNCRACLDADNETDEGEYFFGGLSSFVTQLMTSCTESGGNVYGYQGSICATRYSYAVCASLNSGADSWVSIDSKDDGVTKGSFTLNVGGSSSDDGGSDDHGDDESHGDGEDHGDDDRSHDGTKPTGTGTVSTPEETGSSALPSDSAAPSSSGFTSSTASASGSATSAAPSSSETSAAMGLVASESRLGALAGLAAAFGVGALLL